MRIRRGVVAGAVMAVILSLSPASGMESGSAHKIGVKRLELGYATGKPGLKVRLTLTTGYVVEYLVEDPAELQTVRTMAEVYLSGGARMFAEVDDDVVRGLQVAGPSRVWTE